MWTCGTVEPHDPPLRFLPFLGKTGAPHLSESPQRTLVPCTHAAAMATSAAAAAATGNVAAQQQQQQQQPEALETPSPVRPHLKARSSNHQRRPSVIHDDDVVPPSDASTSPPSPLPSSPAAASRAHTHQPSSPTAHSCSAAAPASAAADARPRLRVVIPPVPPFLHEVDKRDERARRQQLVTSEAATSEPTTTEDAAAFHTPEKPSTSKRKTRSGDQDELLVDPSLAFHESEFRMSQITPPPSSRMLDHQNPPQPPRKAKKRRRVLDRPVNPVTGRLRFSALPLPRLSLSSESSMSSGFSQYSQSSPPRLDTPPGSPVRMASVFRSLADEFAAVQDTPPVRGLRAPPRIARAAMRRCTPPISSRTRSAIQTPTTTMVLRSRQLNPSKSSG